MRSLDACRGHCARLPSYERVRAPAIRAATLARVLGLNHEPDPAARDAALGEWARRETRGWGDLEWFESTAAASGWLTVLALLALAAAGGLDERRVLDTYTAYLPWISLAGTMLDSYADSAQDAADGEHSYIAHYPCAEEAVERLGILVREAALRARALPDGPRHTVLVACMVAMYLSKDSVRTPETACKHPAPRSRVWLSGESAFAGAACVARDVRAARRVVSGPLTPTREVFSRSLELCASTRHQPVPVWFAGECFCRCRSCCASGQWPAPAASLYAAFCLRFFGFMKTR